MKNIYIIISFVCFSVFSFAQVSSNKKLPSKVSNLKGVAQTNKTTTVVKGNSSNPEANKIREAMKALKDGDFYKAAQLFYSISRKSENSEYRHLVRYHFGQALSGLKLPQIAAFQYVDILRSGSSKYTKPAIEKLSVIADQLGDDTLLNYAISKLPIEDFPAVYKDMLFYRLGEIKMKAGDFDQAVTAFSKVPVRSKYGSMALYRRGLANLEQKKVEPGIQAFNTLLTLKSKSGILNPERVTANLALARAYYQAGQWEKSVEYYRNIPRDSVQWHEALFEMTWAQLRSAKFRSALSNFQSLHSPYYDEFFLPESLMLRSIVYLYICKYDEMEKVIRLYEDTYNSIQNQLAAYIKSTKDPLQYYAEYEASLKSKGLINIKVAKDISKDPAVIRGKAYLRTLTRERKKLINDDNLNRANFQKYAIKIIDNRIKNTRLAIGEVVKDRVNEAYEELVSMSEQVGFARYEMINGQKEQLKKKIAGKDIDRSIDEDFQRDFYVQNGYEYWPFKGEYWLDEIGNYQFLGQQSCE